VGLWSGGRGREATCLITCQQQCRFVAPVAALCRAATQLEVEGRGSDGLRRGEAASGERGAASREAGKGRGAAILQVTGSSGARPVDKRLGAWIWMEEKGNISGYADENVFLVG
jgi:hypothetical protein